MTPDSGDGGAVGDGWRRGNVSRDVQRKMNPTGTQGGRHVRSQATGGGLSRPVLVRDDLASLTTLRLCAFPKPSE